MLTHIYLNQLDFCLKCLSALLIFDRASNFCNAACPDTDCESVPQTPAALQIENHGFQIFALQILIAY